MRQRVAFTLIEVLISIALLGIILPALYKSVTLLRDSNSYLFGYLLKAKDQAKSTKTLFLDIASSDGNLTLHKDEFDRLCMEKTNNSLYGLSQAKVCWMVLKQHKTLVRVEGIDFHLPVKEDEQVAVDAVMKGMSLFDIYWKGDKVLVLLQQKGKEPVSFMVQGITKPKPKKAKPKKPKGTKPFKRNRKPEEPHTAKTPSPDRKPSFAL